MKQAFVAKIFFGLRLYENYKLSKHCDNNEVLKALCNETGWTVEEDDTTYRKGCKPLDRMDIVGGSASGSPCSSYHPSPCASYNPSPGSSSFPSPSYYTADTNGNTDANSLIPWLKNLYFGLSSALSKLAHHLYIAGGSISALFTSPLSFPTSRTLQTRNDWDERTAGSAWTGQRFSYLPLSTPPSPSRFLDSGWLSKLELPQSGPTSPTFSLVSRNPFGFKDEIFFK
ncbi:hypothetical protein REPUB_Repub09cG0045300 [Reevesia pubescens]